MPTPTSPHSNPVQHVDRFAFSVETHDDGLTYAAVEEFFDDADPYVCLVVLDPDFGIEDVIALFCEPIDAAKGE